jgi:hypothetical protein
MTMTECTSSVLPPTNIFLALLKTYRLNCFIFSLLVMRPTPWRNDPRGIADCLLIYKKKILRDAESH